MAGRKVSRQSHVEVEETDKHQPIDDKTIASPMKTQTLLEVAKTQSRLIHFEPFRGHKDDVVITKEEIMFKWMTTIRGNKPIPREKKAYYEVTFLEGAKYVARSQVGWVTGEFSRAEKSGRVGDCAESYAYDAQRGCKSHNGFTEDMGIELMDGDPNAAKKVVLSVAADRKNGTILFAINGKWNKRFYDVRTNVELYPAVSGNDIRLSINLGEKKFRNPPPDQTYQSVLEAVQDDATDRPEGHIEDISTPKLSLRGYLGLLSLSFMLSALIALASIGMMVVDIVSDVRISIEYYNVSLINQCNYSHSSFHLEQNRTTASLNTSTFINAKPFHPKHPFWFSLTVTFILLPSMIRICSMNVEQLWKTYLFFLPAFPSKGCCLKTRNGFLCLVCLWIMKIFILFMLPILLIVHQLRKVVIRFRIHYREKLAYPDETFTERCKNFWRDFKQLLQFMWIFLVGTNDTDEESQVNDNTESDEIRKLVAEMAEDISFKKSTLLQLYGNMSDISEDRFFETFLESGPQTILQLTIWFQLCQSERLPLIALITVVSSFYSLAYAVVIYEINLIRKNPAKGEPKLIGQLLITLSKVPGIAARCLGLALFFSSTSLKYKIVGFIGITFITLIFAVYEYSYFLRYSRARHRNLVRPTLSEIIIHMLSRGYVSNFALLHYRTTYFDEEHLRWHDNSEHSKDPPELFPAQYTYYVVMTLVNVLLVYPIYSSGHLKRGLFCHNIIDVIFVCLGAPVSIIFTLLYQHLQHNDWVTQRLGIRSLDALVQKMIQLIKNEQFYDCNCLLKRLSENESIRFTNMLKEQDAFDDKILLSMSKYLCKLVSSNSVTDIKNVVPILTIFNHRLIRNDQGTSVSIRSFMYDALQLVKTTQVNATTEYEILVATMKTRDIFPVLYKAREVTKIRKPSNLTLTTSIQSASSLEVCEEVFETDEEDQQPMNTQVLTFQEKEVKDDETEASEDQPLTQKVEMQIENSLENHEDVGSANTLDCNSVCWKRKEGKRNVEDDQRDAHMPTYAEKQVVKDKSLKGPENAYSGNASACTSLSLCWKSKEQNKTDEDEETKKTGQQSSDTPADTQVKVNNFVERGLGCSAVAVTALFKIGSIEGTYNQVIAKTNFAQEWPGAYGHVSFLHDDIVYLWTGENGLFSPALVPADLIWLYDVKTGMSCLREIKGGPIPDRHGACVGVIRGTGGGNDKALLFGGKKSTPAVRFSLTLSNDLWELDLKTFECLQRHPQHSPDPQYDMKSWVWKNELYIYAGIIDYFGQRTTEVMKFAEGNWRNVKLTGNAPPAISDIILTADIPPSGSYHSERNGEDFVYAIVRKQTERSNSEELENSSVYRLDLAKSMWLTHWNNIPLPVDMKRGSAVMIDSSYVLILTGSKDGKIWAINIRPPRKCWPVAAHPIEYCFESYIGNATAEYCAQSSRLFVFGGLIEKEKKQIAKHIMHMHVENIRMTSENFEIRHHVNSQIKGRHRLYQISDSKL